MSDRLQLIVCRNPLDRRARDISTLVIERKTPLSDLVAAHMPGNLPVSVSLNGVVVPAEHLPLTYPHAGDQVVIVPTVHGGGGGKSILRVIVTIVFTIVGALLGQFYLGPMLGAMMGTAAGSAAGAAIGGAIGSAVGGFIVNALLPPPKPKVPSLSNDFDTSTAYSWNPQTTQQQGLVVPRWYGTVRLYGNVISSHLESDGSQQYMNVLISLGQGPFRRLYDFQINDQPATNFRGVEIHSRLGRLNQAPVPMFGDTKAEYPVAVKIVKNTPYTYVTVGELFTGLEVELTCPNGLWYANDQGGLSPWSVDVRVEIRKMGDAEWAPITRTPTDLQVATGMYWSAGRYLQAKNTYGVWVRIWEQVAEGGNDPQAHYEGELYQHPSKGLLVFYTWRWINGPHTEIAAGEPLDYITITAAQTTVLRRTLRADNLPPGRYEIRVSNLTADQTATRYGDDLYLTAVREILGDEFEYPREVLTGVRALGTDQISGGLRYSCLGDCALVRVWDGTAWAIEWSDNPAWVSWDLFTQPVFYDEWWSGKVTPQGRIVRPTTLNGRLYECTTAGTTADVEPEWPTTIGATVADGTVVWTCRAGAAHDGVIRFDGIDPGRLDLPKWLEWAEFCDELVPDGAGGTEKRITFNGGFDSEYNLWDAIMQVCRMGRAVPVPIGVNYTLAIDKPADPVQLFTVGNTEADSFEETFLPMEDRASEIEIDFINGGRGYTRDRLTVIDPDNPHKTSKTSLQLIGCTSATQAWRAGVYRLACNQALTRMVTWGADVDSITCMIGDVVRVQHDVPEWGAGGRLVSAGISTVTLDRAVEIEEGKTYVVLVRLSDDTVVERTVADGPGTHTTLTVTTPFPASPQPYDVYAFGEATKAVKELRLIGIKRQGNDPFRRLLVGVDYNASVLDVDLGLPVVPTADVSAIDVMPAVTELSREERLVAAPDGTISDTVQLSWRRPLTSTYAKAQIWYSVGGTWNYAGETPFESYSLTVVEARTYMIAVRTVNALGQVMPFENAPTTEITTVGKLAPPADVVAAGCEVIRGQMRIFWTPVTDVDLSGYDLQLGTEWDAVGNKTLVENYRGTSYPWSPDRSGLISILIKARDTSGNLSVAPYRLDYQVAPPGAVAITSVNVIDNLVELSWSAAAPGTFPISHYAIYGGATFATAVYRSRADLLTTLLMESVPGTYKYWVVAVDNAGLPGPETGVYVTVEAPTDYVLLNSQTIDLATCTLTNAVVDNGDVVLPVNTTETFEGHFTSMGWDQPQDQLDAGRPVFIQSGGNYGQVERIIDLGAVISAAKITISVTRQTIVGTVVVSPRISVSADGSTWSDLADAYAAYSVNFRYVKALLMCSTFNDGIVRIQRMDIRMDIKERITQTIVDITDTAGAGTEVTFASLGIAPVDVLGIHPTAPYTGTSADPVKVVLNFTDVPNPTSFRLLAYSKDNVRMAVNAVPVLVRYIE